MAVTLSSIRQLPGIIEVTGDLSASTLIVKYDSAQASEEQITAAVNNIGYTVQGVFNP